MSHGLIVFCKGHICSAHVLELPSSTDFPWPFLATWARLVLRKRCTVVGWRPLAKRGFPRCLSGEATFACVWRVHARAQLRSVCFMSLPFNVWKHTIILWSVGFWMLSGIPYIMAHCGQFFSFSSLSLVVPKCTRSFFVGYIGMMIAAAAPSMGS